MKLQMKASAVDVTIEQHLPPPEEFAAPVVSQVHQEQIVAGETSQNIVEIQTVQGQVIVQEIPEVQVVERIQEQFVVDNQSCSTRAIAAAHRRTNCVHPRATGSGADG